MLYRDFGKTGWQVSAVGMGTWNIGNQWGELDDATAWAAVRSAFDHGVTLFDTAESYGIPNGLSEERLGVALAGIRRRVYLVSKIGHWGKRTGQGVPKTTVDMIRLCAHASLHRLRTDWLDVVLCHEASLKDPSIYLEAFGEGKTCTRNFIPLMAAKTRQEEPSLTILSDRFVPGAKNVTAPLTLFSFTSQLLSQWNLLFAGVVIITIISLIAFIFLQRQLISGMTSGRGRLYSRKPLCRQRPAAYRRRGLAVSRTGQELHRQNPDHRNENRGYGSTHPTRCTADRDRGYERCPGDCSL
jgi:hypothetical protein